MKQKLRLLSFIWGLFLLLSCSHKVKIVPRDIASLKASGVEGIWFLQGTSSARGPYNGELELRRSTDGTYDVVRIATYINSYFDGLKVQEVWTGKAVPTADTLLITYDLRQADFISRLDDKKREPSDFQNTISIMAPFIPEESGLRAQFADKKSSTYSEWITTRRDLEAQPLWKDHRQQRAVLGKPLAPPLQMSLKKFKTQSGFEKSELVQKYKNRSEFKSETPQAIFDPTDFDFYRANKDVIRITNKVLDDISISEAGVRRNAYSTSLSDKQQGFESNTKDFHLNEWGMISYSQVDAKGRFVKYAADDDATVLTGAYLASQAMRYQVTQDKEALFNLRKSLRGLLTLVQIAGQSGDIPRALMGFKPTETLYPGWHKAAPPLVDVIWLDGGDEQGTQALLHGITWAALVIPVSEIETWKSLEEGLQTLAGLGSVKDSRENTAIVEGLFAVLKNDGPSKAKYRQAYASARHSLPSPLDTMYWRGHADWRRVHGQAMSKSSEILIADFLQEPGLRDHLREELLNQWLNFEDSDQHTLTLSALAFAYRHGVRSPLMKKYIQEKSFSKALERARWGLRETPYPRPSLNVEIDRSLSPQWVVSPTPKGFWRESKFYKTAPEQLYQGLFSYPAFEQSAYVSHYAWNDSEFGYKVDHRKEFEESGADYLYAYWLGRYSTMIGTHEKE